MEQKINKGCEFQNDCIEYKDISYLKIMPICAIHELSIACHDKENKCKYYKLYKQLKRLEQENEELKEQITAYNDIYSNHDLLQERDKYKHALEEIKKLTVIGINASQCNCGLRALADDILQIISEVENDK